jgi:hypothetical protein
MYEALLTQSVIQPCMPYGVYVCVCVYVYVYVYMCVCVCMYVCVCMCVVILPQQAPSPGSFSHFLERPFFVEYGVVTPTYIHT